MSVRALPPLKSLRYFRTAGRHMSFKQAAAELCVTPSAVSHQIRHLETDLGLPLFERRTRALAFTPAGRHYFQLLDHVFARLESETRQLRTEFSRTIVRFCVPPFFASEVLLPRLGELQERLPATDLRMMTQPSGMREHPAEADVSILLGNGQWPELQVHRLFSRRLVAACAPGFAADQPGGRPGQLADQVLIAHENRPDAWEEWARSAGVGPLRARNVLRFDSMADVVQAASQGLGIALISWPLGRARLNDGQLQRAFDHEMDTGEHFYLAYRREDAGRDSVRQLSSWLLERFREDG
ncbi:LysR substrate-binding domain-containing protein [Elongatibacter sediminis]|uniref:LysR substrate-binding domain-containing protein n=1 Tax=Elongatibacter sediminis TaxID=3119006 RepID=A0AAW9R7T2_9GAMM